MEVTILLLGWFVAYTYKDFIHSSYSSYVIYEKNKKSIHLVKKNKFEENMLFWMILGLMEAEKTEGLRPYQEIEFISS